MDMFMCILSFILLAFFMFCLFVLLLAIYITTKGFFNARKIMLDKDPLE